MHKFFEYAFCISVLLNTIVSIYIAVTYHILYGIALWIGSIFISFILLAFISICYCIARRHSEVVHPELIKETPVEVVVIHHPDDSLSVSSKPKE